MFVKKMSIVREMPLFGKPNYGHVPLLYRRMSTIHIVHLLTNFFVKKEMIHNIFIMQINHMYLYLIYFRPASRVACVMIFQYDFISCKQEK